MSTTIINKVHNTDARVILKTLKAQKVDVTITSPPYYDLKDYGHEDQIGYGQGYESYLEDLQKVFRNVFECTKETGTLWVIIDTFRRNGDVVPLPFDFSNKISEIGWKLKEVIVWGKDRTVPWAHKGQMRNLFEFVLVFAKSEDYNFYIDRVRDFENLKKWWVKYPERYNPRGKTPDAIWNFDIPTQGSWGDGYIRHFCPLPEEMIEQILKLTTNEGDLVLDTFAGSGAVLAKAENMKRNFVGFELNSEYIEMFENYRVKTNALKTKEYEKSKDHLLPQDKFAKLIIDLRVLKYARVFYEKLGKEGLNGIRLIHVKRSRKKISERNKIVVAHYFIYINDSKEYKKIEKYLREIVCKAPLSKFGIEPIFEFTTRLDDLLNRVRIGKDFIYTNKVTHKYKRILQINNFTSASKSDIIISPIKVDLEEKDFE